jgi:hypothetical protein
LLAHRHSGGFGLREDDVRVVQRQKLVEEMTIAAQRLNARYERTSAASQVGLRTRTAVEAWLKNRPHGTTIEDWVGPDPKPAKGEDILGAVARADLHRVESAPFPSSYGKERMREIVLTWAHAGAPNVSALIEREDGEIWWPMRTLQSTVHNAEGPRPVALPKPSK